MDDDQWDINRRMEQVSANGKFGFASDVVYQKCWEQLIKSWSSPFLRYFISYVFCSSRLGTNEGGATLFTGDYFFQVVGSLLLVIFALLAVMMLLKRFNSVGSSTIGYIQVLASAPLGHGREPFAPSWYGSNTSWCFSG